MTTVRIYLPFEPYYYSFYLDGLREIFGVVNVRYSPRDLGVAGLGMDGPGVGGLAFTIEERPQLRVFIDARDHSDLIEQGLNWADVYGKVNMDSAQLPHHQQAKVVSIGPSFGVRIWNGFSTVAKSLSAYFRARRRVLDPRDHFKAYWNQWHRRLPLSNYVPEPSSGNYVFFAAWPWKKHPEVNPPRAKFIQVCSKVPGLSFEGGFAPRRRRDLAGLENITAPRRYSISEYISKIKRSAFVFNTPAVHECLGWKLGEYLALGKAIISLPLSRTMPEPLLHGTHVHYVDGSEESLRDAIMLLRDDRDYRRQLEEGAAEYYRTHLAPAKALGRLLRTPSTRPV